MVHETFTQTANTGDYFRVPGCPIARILAKVRQGKQAIFKVQIGQSVEVWAI